MSPFDSRLAIALVVLLLAGCGAGTADTAEGADTADASETFAESPAAEGTGAEQPLAAEDDPSISVPTLPVGGDLDVDGVQQCGHAYWTGAPIPPGIEVSIVRVALDPEGIFALEGDLCGTVDAACADGWTWTSATQEAGCTVDVTQLVDTDASVALVLEGRVACPSAAECEEFAGSEGLFAGTQLVFTAESGLLAAEADDPSDSASASEATDSASASEATDSASPSTSEATDTASASP